MIKTFPNLLSNTLTFTMLIEYQELSKTMLKVIKIHNMNADNLDEGTPILYKEYRNSTKACQTSINYSLYKGNEVFELEGSHYKHNGKTLDEVMLSYSDTTILISEYDLQKKQNIN